MFVAEKIPHKRIEGWRYGNPQALAQVGASSHPLSLLVDDTLKTHEIIFENTLVRIGSALINSVSLEFSPVMSTAKYGHLLQQQDIPTLSIVCSEDMSLVWGWRTDPCTNLSLQCHIIVKPGISASISTDAPSDQLSIWMHRECHVGAGATLSWVEASTTPFSNRLGTANITLERAAKFVDLDLSVGGKFVHDERHVYMNEDSSAHLFAGHLLEDNHHRDLHFCVRHLAAGALSSQDVRAVVGDQSVSGFDGLIHVAEGARATQAFQQAKILLLNDGATHHGKPELEIFHDDVICSHGVAIGNIDDEALFYLTSRGIPEKRARDMLLRAFIYGLVEAAAVELGGLTPDDAVVDRMLGDGGS